MAPDRTIHEKPTQLAPYEFVPAMPPRKGEPGYIPRPRNKWIIFRAEFAKKTSYSDFKDARAKATSDSKAAQRAWAELSPEDRRPYELAAAEEKRRHNEMYPDYRFCPVKRDKTVKIKATRNRKCKPKEEEEEEGETLLLYPLSDAAPVNGLVQNKDGSYESQSVHLKTLEEGLLGLTAENAEIPYHILPFTHCFLLDPNVSFAEKKLPAAASPDDPSRFIHWEPPSEPEDDHDDTDRLLYPIDSVRMSLAREPPRPSAFPTPRPIGISPYAPISFLRTRSPPFFNDRKFLESVGVSLPPAGGYKYEYQSEEAITFSRPPTGTRDGSVEPAFREPGPSSETVKYARGFSHCSLSSDYDLMLPRFRDEDEDEDDDFKSPGESASRSLATNFDLEPNSPVSRRISLGVFGSSAKCKRQAMN